MKTIAFFSFLFLSSCAAPVSLETPSRSDWLKEPVFRKDRGSNLIVLFFGPHQGMVTRAAKGYTIGDFSDEWEVVTDNGVWTEPDWTKEK